MAEVMRRLGYHPAGGVYMHLRRKISRFGISTDHWLGQGWAIGLTGDKRIGGRPKREATQILVLGTEGDEPESGSILTRALTERGRPYNCASCSLGNLWNGAKIVLQVDHVNGLRYDNREDNLRFLCPNCHSQTDTYCGRKLRKQHSPRFYLCIVCGKSIRHKGKRCRSCGQKQRTNRQTKIAWPDDDILLRMVTTSSRVAVGRELGVSDNAILKRLKRRNLVIPTRWFINQRSWTI
jgi:hypothetical protein